MIKENKKTLGKKICTIIWNIIVTISLLSLVWYFLIIFVYSTFKIPSPSMSPTLLPGDHIIVNKMAYGARLFDVRKTIRHGDITRIWGYSAPKRNDIMVFNFPYYQNWDSVSFDVMRYFVKRCVALPGDTFEIRNGFYKVRGFDGDLGNIDAQQQTERQTRDTICQNDPNISYWTAPFNHSVYHWNIREFGPLYIPKHGDKLTLDTINAPIYKKLIEWELNAKITNDGNRFYAGDSLMGAHTVRQDYFFMAGDNNLESQDSRYWGLVPEEFIVGRVWIIWKSENIFNGSFNWNRMLTTVK